MQILISIFIPRWVLGCGTLWIRSPSCTHILWHLFSRECWGQVIGSQDDRGQQVPRFARWISKLEIQESWQFSSIPKTQNRGRADVAVWVWRDQKSWLSQSEACLPEEWIPPHLGKCWPFCCIQIFKWWDEDYPVLGMEICFA